MFLRTKGVSKLCSAFNTKNWGKRAFTITWRIIYSSLVSQELVRIYLLTATCISLSNPNHLKSITSCICKQKKKIILVIFLETWNMISNQGDSSWWRFTINTTSDSSRSSMIIYAILGSNIFFIIFRERHFSNKLLLNIFLTEGDVREI